MPKMIFLQIAIYEDRLALLNRLVLTGQRRKFIREALDRAIEELEVKS